MLLTCSRRHLPNLNLYAPLLIRNYQCASRRKYLIQIITDKWQGSSEIHNFKWPCLGLFIRTMATASGSGASSGQRNRLAQEKSPYLLQHASNPVHWYPWGREAFEAARSQNKLIFLSVGYSTCHWCHVMERESFENEEIGAILNDHFISIKVDREERPDVDKVYMTFIQATSGGGGWPMSVWLTPDLKPIYGGTYFPPSDRYYGRPGFKTLLKTIAKQWTVNHVKISEQGHSVIDALAKGTEIKAEKHQTLPGSEVIQKCFNSLAKSYDAELGGFNKEPKFPQPCNFNLLFRIHHLDPTSSHGKHALQMALHTLRKMAQGGIHDHIAQGFHRYSTDRQWHVPHFEKMLYDQAQLAVSYSEAYQITKDEFFADIVRDILLYVSRDLSDKSGGFYSAEDADSYPTHDATEKKEGAFCVWTHKEIYSLLNQPVEGVDDTVVADVFSAHYSVQEHGNVNPYQDPHEELKGQNVLMTTGCVEETSGHFNLDVQVTERLLQQAREKLYATRKTRPPPHLDNKMLTAWNGLMISGFAKAGQALHDAQYVDRAVRAAEFINTHLYNSHNATLLRSCYVQSETQSVTQISEAIPGFLDDYAFLIAGLLDLYEACHDTRWLSWAETLQHTQNSLFWDKEGGGFYMSDAADASIVLRMKDDQDGAEPSANSVSALNLLRLASFLDDKSFLQQAEKLLILFSQRLREIPVALPQMICALIFLQQTPKQIIIRGDADAAETQTLLTCVHAHFLPHKVLMLARGQDDAYLYEKLPLLATLTMQDGKSTAYVCENYTCSLPTTTVSQLEKLLSSANSEPKSQV